MYKCYTRIKYFIKILIFRTIQNVPNIIKSYMNNDFFFFMFLYLIHNLKRGYYNFVNIYLLILFQNGEKSPSKLISL